MSENDLVKAEFFVEADDFARLMLWERYAKDAGGPGLIDWQQDSVGFSAVVGWYGKLPVNVCFLGTRLNGKFVVFYEAVSQVTDSVMIEEWIKERASPKYDNGRRSAFTNAMNFHHCIDHVLDCWPRPDRPRSQTGGSEAAVGNLRR